MSMMLVTVQVPRMLRAHAENAAELEVEVEPGATLGTVLDVVAARHPALERRLRDEQKALRRYVNFYVDGDECRARGGAAAPLVDGAEVRVVPSVAGG